MYQASLVGEAPAELRRRERFSAHSIVYIQSSGVRSFRRRLRDVSHSGVFVEDPGAQSDWLARVTPAGIGFRFAPRVEVLEATK
jgi:hypothetical protein